MGKLKATLPDYPTVDYEFDSSFEDQAIKVWAMEQAMKVTKKDGLTHEQYAQISRVLAQELMNEIKKLK